MKEVTLYTTRYCPFCVRAKQLLESRGVAYREIGVGNDPQLRSEMMNKSGQRTVPQIWIGDRHVGGCNELYALQRSGELDRLLEEQAAETEAAKPPDHKP